MPERAVEPPDEGTPAFLRLPALLRADVLDEDGRRIGRLEDVTVGLGDRSPSLRRALVRPDDGPRVLLDGRLALHVDHRPSLGRVPLVVTGGSRAAVQERRPEGDGGDDDLTAQEVYLARDVLDTQIVDVVGHRIRRVSDVLLAILDDGSLEAAGVDVGFAAVVHRIGPIHRFPAVIDTDRRDRVDAIGWEDLHLTSTRGHLVQLDTPAAALHRLDTADLARLVGRLSTQHAADILAGVSPERAAEAIGVVQHDVGHRIVAAMTEEDLGPVLAALPEADRHRVQRHRATPRPRRYTRHRRNTR